MEVEVIKRMISLNPEVRIKLEIAISKFDALLKYTHSSITNSGVPVEFGLLKNDGKQTFSDFKKLHEKLEWEDEVGKQIQNCVDLRKVNFNLNFISFKI